MSKKLSRKLLSIVLVLAICITTVFGCLMTVTAAEPYADDGTYTITVGDENGAVPMGSVKVPAQVKFDFEGGFLGGEFTVDNTEGNYASVTDVKVVAATDFNGNAASVENFGIYQEDFLIGFFDESQYFKSITLEYTLNLGTDSNGQIYVGTGKAIAIDIIPNKAAFGIPAGDEFVFEITETEDSMSQFHAHGAWNDDTVTYQKDGKHHVGRGNCTVCQNTLGLPYQEYSSVQIIPDYTEFDDVTATIKSAEGWVGVSGVNVTYNTDGSIDINVHAYRHWGGKPSYLIVTDLDGNELYRTQAYDDAAQSTYVADKGGVLGNNAKMFTLAGLSMQDFADGFLFTLCTIDGTNLRHSKSVKFSLRDYALSVVDENATWPEGTPDEQIELDKRIAAALCYYGASIDPEVFKSITDESGKVEGPKGEEGEGGSTATGHVATDTWDGTFVEPTKTDSEGNIIIENAEQLAWVALKGGAATNGVKYKVADNQVFDLNGFTGITLDSTVAEVKAATPTGKYWRGTADATYFGGTEFDGNGLIVYNANSRFDGSDTGGHGGSGLFPYAQPYQGAETQTFKNVMITASAFKSYHGAGGLIGYANPNTTDRKWVIDNVAVDSVLLFTHTHNQTAGGIVGIAGHTGTTITNALVSDIEFVANKKAGLVASTSNFSPAHTFSNSVTVGIAPESTETGSKLASATYTNVYTDVTTAKGTQVADLSGKACANLDFNTVWFANDGAPVLRVFHDFSKTVDNKDGTHSVKCSVCGFAGLAEVHSFGAANAEGVATCACGLTKKSHIVTDTWDGTFVQPTKTEGDYTIIENAEQLAWVALKGGAAT
ncbi:MAG: hypothetical protein Q4B40_06375, partial [Clostridia bacterium]|nr:hypothetical protein [Clostridia bacterium]